MDQLTGFISRHLECTAAIRYIIPCFCCTHVVPTSLLCSLLLARHSAPPWKTDTRKRSFLNRAKKIYLPQLVFLSQLETTRRMAYLLCLSNNGISKTGNGKIGRGGRPQSLSPLQPLIPKSHGLIHCEQIPMPAVIRKAPPPALNPFAYSLKPLLVYITFPTQCTAAVIQLLVLLDRSGSLQPQRRENSGSKENSCLIDIAGSNSSAWPSEEDGECVHEADLPILLGCGWIVLLLLFLVVVLVCDGGGWCVYFPFVLATHVNPHESLSPPVPKTQVR